jgi:hypothetical protein
MMLVQRVLSHGELLHLVYIIDNMVLVELVLLANLTLEVPC